MKKGSFFGTLPDGSAVYAYEIASGDICATVLTRGATLQSLRVFGRDVIGGYDRLTDYLADTGSYQGQIIGRVANRIGGARFEMDGKEFHVSANNGENCLHGGISGFGEKSWRVKALGSDHITLTYLSSDGEEGFPSSVSVQVTYKVFDNSIMIDYRAVPNGSTPISLTNHTYFNLEGLGGTVLSHEVEIYADRYTEVSEQLIPTGRCPSVEGTVFDFRCRRRIGEGLSESFEGYDHNFVLTPEVWRDFHGTRLGLAARVWGGSLAMSVYTDRPGVQFYIGNFLGDGPAFKGGVPQIKHGAFCLETQTEPNGVQRGVGFYSSGEVYTHSTVYAFERAED